MYARVANWEGGERDQVRSMIEQINERAESEGGPPEGVPAKSFLLLHSEDGSKVLAITLFETESDYEQGDATLNSMDPPTPGGMGSRSSVDRYEVGVQLEVDS
jgi:hypothetical protein